MKLSVTRRNLLPKEDTSCDRKKPPLTVRNTKKHLKIDLQTDEHNAGEEMEIAENIALLQNTYTIFKNAMNDH
jgi:hypothetical protein